MPYSYTSADSGTAPSATTPPPAPPAAPLPNDYESSTLDAVLPGGSNTFDPFTSGQPGSPFGPGELFAPGIGTSRCGPMALPMSAQFADPGDTQASIIVIGNGLECIPEIFHEKPGVAISFQFIGAPFTNVPWVILSDTGTIVTITNGAVTLRFHYSITRDTTTISQVEYV